jgi:hypothetical protein
MPRNGSRKTPLVLAGCMGGVFFRVEKHNVSKAHVGIATMRPTASMHGN